MTDLRKTLAVLGLFVALSSYALANPVGQTVVNGEVVFSNPDPSTLRIDSSAGAIIEWQDFSIATGETTRFVQPDAAAAVLNRVTGSIPSDILGTLSANGRVFLMNPNGIFFGPESIVDVGGLVASTMDLSNSDFLEGRYDFLDGAGAGVEIADGALITTSGRDGGQVWLFAHDVRMGEGARIETPGGQAILGAGESVLVGESELGSMIFEVATAEGTDIDLLGEIAAERGAAGLFADSIALRGRIAAPSGEGGELGFVALHAAGGIDIGPAPEGPRPPLETPKEERPGIQASGELLGDGGTVVLEAGGRLRIDADARVRADGGVDGGDGGALIARAHRVEIATTNPTFSHFRASARAAGGMNGEVVVDETAGETAAEVLRGPLVEPSQDPSDNLREPKIAARPENRFRVLFELDADGEDHYTFVVDPASGGLVSPPERAFDTSMPSSIFEPVVVPAGEGIDVLFVAEEVGNTTNDTLFVGRVSDEGVSQPLLRAAEGISINNEMAARLADGRLLALWSERMDSGDDTPLQAAVVAADGSAIENRFEIPKVDPADEKDRTYGLVGLADGSFVLAREGLTRDETLFERFDMQGNPIGDPLEFAFQPRSDSFSMSALADGGFIVVRNEVVRLADGYRVPTELLRFDADGALLERNTHAEILPDDRSALYHRVVGLADGGYALSLRERLGDDASGRGFSFVRFDSADRVLVREDLLIQNLVTNNDRLSERTRDVEIAAASDGSAALSYLKEGIDYGDDAFPSAVGVDFVLDGTVAAPLVTAVDGELGAGAGFDTVPGRSNAGPADPGTEPEPGAESTSGLPALRDDPHLEQELALANARAERDMRERLTRFEASYAEPVLRQTREAAFRELVGDEHYELVKNVDGDARTSYFDDLDNLARQAGEGSDTLRLYREHVESLSLAERQEYLAGLPPVARLLEPSLEKRAIAGFRAEIEGRLLNDAKEAELVDEKSEIASLNGLLDRYGKAVDGANDALGRIAGAGEDAGKAFADPLSELKSLDADLDAEIASTRAELKSMQEIFRLVTRSGDDIQTEYKYESDVLIFANLTRTAAEALKAGATVAQRLYAQVADYARPVALEYLTQVSTKKGLSYAAQQMGFDEDETALFLSMFKVTDGRVAWTLEGNKKGTASARGAVSILFSVLDYAAKQEEQALEGRIDTRLGELIDNMREQGRVGDVIAYLQNKLDTLERLDDHASLRQSYVSTAARFGVRPGPG